jgi:DNA topoisomerase-1
MSTKLVIVESPAKAQTINNYLGADYNVLASFGHVRDLPSSVLGVDVENDFEPKYIIPAKSKRAVSAIKQASKGASEIYLATDLDREGEAIAWHVAEAVGGAKSKFKRITFSEITKDAILQAVKNPRSLDMDLVDAQQARRVLDRLVGYNLSPLLWKKIMKGLSAGRVQSVAVRMVVDREREIEAFKPEEYWSVIAILQKEKIDFEARLIEAKGKRVDKLEIKSQNEAEDIKKNLKDDDYIVASVEKKTEARHPYAPYTTSSLQQDSANNLGYSAKQTMRLAQILYEAGFITYMRTDSVTISQGARDVIKKLIITKFGENYLPTSARVYKTKTKRAQEAHECIRPSDPGKDAESLPAGLDGKTKKLYDLIWRRTIASQMKEATLAIEEAKIKNTDYLFSTRGQTVAFAGWLALYPQKVKESVFPDLKVGEKLAFVELKLDQHFTEPPARYSEATLIKAMEEKGIGRPSTYAPTMGTIQDRGYVLKEAGRLKPEKAGFVVNDLLVEHFPDIVDYNFTAKVEDDLDDVAEGKVAWKKVIRDFYGPFAKKILEGTDKIVKTSLDEKSDEKCPDCGKDMVVKYSKNGKFLGCSGFPDCRYTKSIVSEKMQEQMDEGEKLIEGRKCPKCGGDLKIARGKFGPFIGCSKYPDCKYIERIAKPKQ